MKFYVFLIADNGDGIPMRMEDWDGEDALTLRLSAFAKDAVITIEPIYEHSSE